MTDLTFFYVTDGPRLQTQAVLLAKSLRDTHPLAAQIAYVPTANAAALPEPFRHAMAAFNVEIREIPEPAETWRAPYPHGNKILAAAEPRETRHSVFLDSDMFAVKPLLLTDLPTEMEVSVVPEGVIGWGEDLTRWERVYAHFDLPVPEERIRMLRGARRMSPPYFNAGFVAFREDDRIDGKSFGALWRETASEIDWKVSVGGKRPWLDQISLPVALKRFGFTTKVVAERNNTSISHDRALDDLDPAILHYHRARFLRRWPGIEVEIAETIGEMPQSSQDWLRGSLSAGGFIDALDD